MDQAHVTYKGKEPSLWLTLTGSSVMVFLFSFWFCAVYQSSDDAGQRFMNEGLVLASHPYVNPYLSTPVFSMLVILLTYVIPSISGHGLVLVILLGITFGLFFHRLIVMALDWKLKLTAFLFLFFVLGLNFVVFIQFTAVGILMSFVGTWYFLDKNSSKKERTLGWLCLFLGFACRPEAGILGFLLGLPLVYPSLSIYFSNAGFSTLRNLFFAGCGLILLHALLYAYTINQKPWVPYLDFHFVQAKPILDNDYLPYGPETKHVYQSIGWSENDYTIFTQWYFGDTLVFNRKKLAQLHAAAKSAGIHPSKRSFSQAWEEFYFHGRQSQFGKISLGLVLVLNLLLIGIHRKNSIKLLVLGVYFLSICSFLCLFMKFPPWVAQPLFSSWALILVSWLPLNFALWKKEWFLMACVSVAGLICIGISYVYLQRAKIHELKYQKALETLKTVREQPEKLFWITPDFPWNDIPVFFSKEKLNFQHAFYTATFCQTPLAFDFWKKNHISNPVKHLVSSKSTLVLTNPRFCIMYALYCKEHYGWQVDFSKIKDAEGYTNLAFYAFHLTDSSSLRPIHFSK